MNTNSVIMLLAAIIFAASFSFAESESPSEQHWDLQEVLSFKSAAYWVGTQDPCAITVGQGVTEGQSCIVVPIDIKPGHLMRIEKNYVADCHRGFRNMMAFGMIDEDLSAYRTITFQYTTDTAAIDTLIFRVYDREGGWIQWDIPQTNKKSEWQKVTLSIPSKAWPVFNLHRWGGILWELHAGKEPIKGLFKIADFQLLDKCIEGLKGQAKRPEKVDHQTALNPPSVQSPYPNEDFHLIMNMTGEIGNAMAAHQTDLAVRRLSEAVAVFRGIPELEYFFMPEAWMVKKNPTTEELKSGQRPDPVEWLEKVQKTYVAMAEWCEQNKAPFYVGICHSADHQPLIPAAIVKACIEAAPNTCRGALMGEFSIESNGGIDGTLETMKLLKEKGLKMIYFQQSSYWFGIMMPAGNEFRQKLLAPEFKDVFVPMGEYVVPSAQGLSMATLIGMWQGGLVNNWGISAQSWGYANMNWGGTSDQPGSYWLRLFLTTAAFGGRYIEIEPKWAFDGENVPGQIEHFKQWAHNLRWVGQRRAQIDIDIDPSDEMRGLMLFNRLIRQKAIMSASKPENLISISPAVFQVEHTPQWGQWDVFHRAVDKHFYDGCCPNYTDMSAQVPSQDAFAYLYGSNHFYDQTFSDTRYGLVSILPAESSASTASTLFKTDGKTVFYEGKKLSAVEAKSIIQNTFRRVEKDSPFSVSGCTWSAIEVAKGDYLIVLIDPEERFPVEVVTTLKVNLSGTWQAMDGMTSAPLNKQGHSIEVRIPASGFRIIRVINKS